jgi:trimethylamine--corrinoid protein Co-methyltransferase
MRRLWMPRLFDRSSWEEWSAAGRPDAAFRAGERVRALLETHEPTPLPSGVGDELDRIVSEASAIAAAAG